MSVFSGCAVDDLTNVLELWRSHRRDLLEMVVVLTWVDQVYVGSSVIPSGKLALLDDH